MVTDAQIEVVGIDAPARCAERAEELLHHYRAERGQIALGGGRERPAPGPFPDCCKRGLEAPGVRECAIVSVLLGEEGSERAPRGTSRRVEEHARCGCLTREAPGGLVHQEVANERRIVARAGKLLTEALGIGVPARIEDVRKIAVDERRGTVAPREWPDVREPGRARDFPVRPVGDRVESQAAQLSEGDRGPLVVPAGSERADEVRGQVVDRAAAIRPHVVNLLELTLHRRHPRERPLEPVVIRRRVHAHRHEPGRPEGMAIGIEQPPARAVMMGPEVLPGLVARHAPPRQAAPR